VTANRNLPLQTAVQEGAMPYHTILGAHIVQ
jgi:hypothetical protein